MAHPRRMVTSWAEEAEGKNPVGLARGQSINPGHVVYFRPRVRSAGRVDGLARAKTNEPKERASIRGLATSPVPMLARFPAVPGEGRLRSRRQARKGKQPHARGVPP
jgi:hypothetical protein